MLQVQIQLPASNFRKLEVNFQLATSGPWFPTSKLRKLDFNFQHLEVGSWEMEI